MKEQKDGKTLKDERNASAEVQADLMAEREAATEPVRELAVNAVLVFCSLLILAESIHIWVENPGVNSAGLFPTIVSAVLLLCAVIPFLASVRVYRGWKAGKKWEGSGWDKIKLLCKTEMPFNTFFMAVMIIFYVIAFTVIDFYVATAIFMLATMLVFYQGKKVLQSILVTAGTLVALYLIIDLLFKVHL